MTTRDWPYTRRLLSMVPLLAACASRDPGVADCLREGPPSAPPGTHCCEGPASAVACLPCENDVFDLRLATTEIRADGATPVAVLAIGTDLLGEPSSATVFLALSREDAGSIPGAPLTLTPLGALTEFVPCDAAESGCLGTFSVGLYYPGEPTEILVRAEGVLVAD